MISHTREAAFGDGRCRTTHCDHQGVGCSYVDRSGRRCPTHWCAEHAELVAGYTYCRRHAGTLAALGSGAGRLMVRPLVDNRAASLAGWVANHLDTHILALLGCMQSDDETLVSDASVSAHDDGRRATRWHRGWSLVAPAGVTTRVIVEISEEDDAMVRIRVGRNLVFTAVPPWIAWRRLGLHVPEPVDAAARTAFYAKAKSAIAEELVRLRLGTPPIPPSPRATDGSTVCGRTETGDPDRI